MSERTPHNLDLESIRLLNESRLLTETLVRRMINSRSEDGLDQELQPRGYLALTPVAGIPAINVAGVDPVVGSAECGLYEINYDTGVTTDTTDVEKVFNFQPKAIPGETFVLVLDVGYGIFVVAEVQANARLIKASLNAALTTADNTVKGTVVDFYRGAEPTPNDDIDLYNLEAPGGSSFVFEGAIGTYCWADHMEGNKYAIKQMGCSAS